MHIRIAQALFALCIVAATAPAAQAYRIEGHRWPGSTITYYNASGYRAEVSTAVRTWNASGVRIRFKATSRSAAQVQILRGGKPGCKGFAQLGYVRGRRAVVHLGTGCPSSSGMTGVAAHELGHILGLMHEDRTCAAMNTHLGEHCDARPAWTYLCRYLETDDVTGAVRRYGGTVRPVPATAACPLFAAPQAPGGLTLAYANGSVAATATIPEPARLAPDPGPVIWAQLLLWRYPNACPPDAGTGDPHRRLPAVYGTQTTIIDAGPPAGTWCYAMAVSDGSGRRTPAAVATVLVA